MPNHIPGNVAFIPAKGRSERLPGKNTRTIGGRSLVRIAAETALAARVFDVVYVDTESEEVAREVEGLGVEWLKRDPKLSCNSVGANDLLRNEVNLTPPARNYFMLNCCTPLVRPTTIRECVLQFDRSTHDSVLTVVPFAEYLWNQGRPNYDLDHVPTSNLLPPTFMETHALYGIRREAFLKLSRRVGRDILFFPTSKREAVDINSEEDLILAAALWDIDHENN